jgi:membrane protease YdiL (CAAX protease family)
MFPFVYEINPGGWLHLFYFGLLFPLTAVLRRRTFHNVKVPLPNRLLHFRRTAATLVMFGALSLFVAGSERIELFPRTLPPWRGIAAGLLMYVFAVMLMRGRWRRAVEKRLRIVYLFMPSTGTERTWWIIVAILAGITEEITWRGVQAALAIALTRNILIAILFCSISFGVGHIIQGWKTVVIIFVFAVGFHALVWLSGSLYVAMAVHIAYDVTAGISYGRLGRELGYEPSEATEPPSAVVPET